MKTKVKAVAIKKWVNVSGGKRDSVEIPQVMERISRKNLKANEERAIVAVLDRDYKVIAFDYVTSSNQTLEDLFSQDYGSIVDMKKVFKDKNFCEELPEYFIIAAVSSEKMWFGSGRFLLTYKSYIDKYIKQ